MSIQDAVQLAQMELPGIYRARKKPPLWKRVFGLAKPGPKPKQSEKTIRGKFTTQLSSTLGNIGDYREDPVSFDTLDKIRRSPMVKLATVVRTAPMLSSLKEIKIKCEDVNIKAFIDEVLVKELLLEVAESSIVPSYVYGVAPHEKVWENREVKATYMDEETQEERTAFEGMALVYKKVKFVHPVTLEDFIVDPQTRDFDGFMQKSARAGGKPTTIEAWKSFVFINRFLYGGLWGESEYTDIYPFWYYSEFFRALLADYMRYKAIPPIVGHAPVGVRDDPDGNEVDNLTYAGEILQSAYDNLVVMLPYETDEGGKNQWGFNELNISERADIFHKSVEELEVMILRGLLVPERTVTQNMAAVGSYNQAKIHAEQMVEAAKIEVDRYLKAVNKFLIPQLVEDNFGQGAPECSLFARGFSEELKEKLFNVLITIIQNDRENAFRRHIAFTELLDFLNIPFTNTPTGMPEPEDESVPDEEESDEEEPEEEEVEEETV